MKNNKTFVRVMCWILAGIMLAGTATTLIAVLFSQH
jgi:hypothetical protein